MLANHGAAGDSTTVLDSGVALYRKNKSQIFPEFLVDDFNPKKIKQIHKDRKGSR